MDNYGTGAGMAGEWTGGMFEFGSPESVISKRDLFDMFQIWHNGRWYEPAISQIGIGRAFRVAPHHQSAILLKRNLLEMSFVESPLMDGAAFSQFALDYLVYGNAYLQVARSRLGGVMALDHAPAAWMRVGVESGVYWFAMWGQVKPEIIEFAPGEIVHIKEYDPLQEIYGLPSYISALQSGLLNENTTLFRRKFYLNGSHSGYILQIDDPAFSKEDEAQLIEQMRMAKGPGNFRNMFLKTSGKTKDAVKIIPISQERALDEFMHIKEVTRDDLLAAHRVPPQLEGIVPKNGTGFGNVIDAVRAFYVMEIMPLQRQLARVNRLLGAEVVKFAMPQALVDLDPAQPSVKG